MALLKQDIRSPSRTGKTTMLLALAAGYAAQGLEGVIVTRTDGAAREFKKRHATPFDVLRPADLVSYLIRCRSECQRRHQVFLLEDADMMSSKEGHPAALLEKAFRETEDKIVVVSFYTDNQSDAPILMSRNNPDGFKLEMLTEKLREEINRKSLNIAGDPSFAAQTVTNNNFQIIGLLMQIEALQRQSFVVMAQIGPDQGPKGKPRIGGE